MNDIKKGKSDGERGEQRDIKRNHSKGERENNTAKAGERKPSSWKNEGGQRDKGGKREDCVRGKKRGRGTKP